MSTAPRTDNQEWTTATGEKVVWASFARSLQTELANAIQISAKYENRYFETFAELTDMKARAEKAEASLHNVSLDLSTANHMIKLERDCANALQTRLNEISDVLDRLEKL